MSHHTAEHQDRYIPARTNEGWGIAGLVVLLAVLCAAGATYTYQKTHRHPTDLKMEAAGAHTPAVGAAH